jgi:hypothetical protein
MRKLIVATASLGIFVAASAVAQTPPQPNPSPTQPSRGGMIGDTMMGSDSGCPMMKKMASLEERLKKLEQNSPKQ